MEDLSVERVDWMLAVAGFESLETVEKLEGLVCIETLRQNHAASDQGDRPGSTSCMESRGDASGESVQERLCRRGPPAIEKLPCTQPPCEFRGPKYKEQGPEAF